MTAKEIDDLGKLKVNDLQAKFAEVVGEATRSPNKTYLLRRIREAIAAGTPAPTGSEAEPESQSEDANIEAGEASDAAKGTSVAEPVFDAPVVPAELVEAETPLAALKLSKLDVPTLQVLYAEVLGRETRSTARNYLIWKIREGQKGRVPLGPRPSRRHPGDKVMVLPLRMESSVVDRLDEAWARLGLGSRMDLFRTALRAYFEEIGERDLAELIAPEA